MLNLKTLFTKKPTASPSAARTDDLMPSTTDARGASIGQRPLKNPAWAGEYTPERIATILDRAEHGDDYAIADFFALADKVIEREMHTAGVVNGLVLAVAGLEHKAVVRKGFEGKRAQKIADEVQALMAPSSALRLAAPGIISQGITHGLGVASVLYEQTNAAWKPVDFVQKPAHFFTFDRRDGRTPMLRSAVAGQPAEPLVPGASIAFTPRRNSALQVKNSLAWILCWAYAIKSIVLADEMAFLQLFGHPIVYGKYNRGASEADVSMLQRAVSALNNSFRAVFRDDLNIEFKEIARNSTDLYEKVCRYLDEQISKVVWASTLTTDAGGSGTYALGKVHAEGKYDVVRSYAHQWSACLQEFATIYVAINYGPEAPVPEIKVDVEEAEDLVAGSTIVANLAAAGVALDASEVRRKFGFSDPQAGAEVIGRSALAEPPAAVQNARQLGCPVHSSNAAAPGARDHLDDLADSMLNDWEQVTAPADAALLEAALSSNSLEEMRAALLSVIESGSIPTSELQAFFTTERAKARLGGNTGVQL